MTECVVHNKYRIIERIGTGKFGSVYKGINIKTNTYVAIKMERLESSFPLLKHESTILNYLYNEGLRNTPAVYWYGLYGENLCTVMTLCEQSLYTYSQNRVLPIETIYSIIFHCIESIETVHQKFVLHRDIKPQNIMFRGGSIYLIDFGLSIFYINDKKEHIADKISHGEITGTPKWCSYNVNAGHYSSRRDDLISLGYIFLFLLRGGNLPWDGLVIEDKRTEYIKYKESSNIIPLAEDAVLKEYFKFCYGLSFSDEPDYFLLKHFLKNNIKG
jgi:casein kinase 1